MKKPSWEAIKLWFPEKFPKTQNPSNSKPQNSAATPETPPSPRPRKRRVVRVLDDVTKNFMLQDLDTGEKVPLHYLQTEGVDKLFNQNVDWEKRRREDEEADRRPLTTPTNVTPQQLNEILKAKREEILPIVKRTETGIS